MSTVTDMSIEQYTCITINRNHSEVIQSSTSTSIDSVYLEPWDLIPGLQSGTILLNHCTLYDAVCLFTAAKDNPSAQLCT